MTNTGYTPNAYFLKLTKQVSKTESLMQMPESGLCTEKRNMWFVQQNTSLRSLNDTICKRLPSQCTILCIKRLELCNYILIAKSYSLFRPQKRVSLSSFFFNEMLSFRKIAKPHCHISTCFNSLTLIQCLKFTQNLKFYRTCWIKCYFTICQILSHVVLEAVLFNEAKISIRKLS